MRGIAVYMEGGGHSSGDRSLLRLGMSQFLSSLRDAARRKRLEWKVVPCGSRDGAHGAFEHANKKAPETFNVLLVDSEEAVAESHSPRAHLQQRDGWKLTDASEDSIHLMIQVMEAWIVADPDAAAKYYGQHFLIGTLPRSVNLEGVEKEQIYGALNQATAKTLKRKYQKIRDAAALLGRIDPDIVRRRCPSCERLFATLTQRIDAA